MVMIFLYFTKTFTSIVTIIPFALKNELRMLLDGICAFPYHLVTVRPKISGSGADMEEIFATMLFILVPVLWGGFVHYVLSKFI